MKVWLLIISLSTSVFHLGSKEQCRTAFHNAIGKESALNQFISQYKAEKEDLTVAYVGIATSMMAEHASFPNKKYAYFNDGKKRIEQAVKSAPNNPEIRYLRLLVQLKAPYFVYYDDEIPEDLALFEQKILSYSVSSTWKHKMIDNLIITGELSSAQERSLKSLKSKI